MSEQRESIELTEAEATVLTKVTAAAYRGSAYSFDRAERAALRRVSIKAQDAREKFPFRMADRPPPAGRA